MNKVEMKENLAKRKALKATADELRAQINEARESIEKEKAKRDGLQGELDAVNLSIDDLRLEALASDIAERKAKATGLEAFLAEREGGGEGSFENESQGH